MWLSLPLLICTIYTYRWLSCIQPTPSSTFSKAYWTDNIYLSLVFILCQCIEVLMRITRRKVTAHWHIFLLFPLHFCSFFLHTTIGTAHSQVSNVKTEMLLNWNADLLARLSVDARASMYYPSAKFTDQHSVNFKFLYCAPYWWLDIIQQWIRPMSRWRKGVKRKMLLNWNTWEMNQPVCLSADAKASI